MSRTLASTIIANEITTKHHFLLHIMFNLMHYRCSEILHTDNNIYNEFVKMCE